MDMAHGRAQGPYPEIVPSKRNAISGGLRWPFRDYFLSIEPQTENRLNSSIYNEIFPL